MSFVRQALSAVFALSLAGASLHAAPLAAQEKPAPQLSAAETAVLDAESKRFDAQVAHDVAALNPLIADDAVYIHATGDTQTKAEYLRDVDAGKSRYRSIEPSERVARVMGNIGITHGMITLNVGVDRKIVARYTGVYVLRDGHWQVVSFQTTPLTQRQ